MEELKLGDIFYNSLGTLCIVYYITSTEIGIYNYKGSNYCVSKNSNTLGKYRKADDINVKEFWEHFPESITNRLDKNNLEVIDRIKRKTLKRFNAYTINKKLLLII